MTETDQITDEEFDAFMRQYEAELMALARRRLFPAEPQEPREADERQPEEHLAV